MHKPKIMLWLHDSNKTASGKPGAVQTLLDTFDWYAPKYEIRQKHGRVRQLLAGSGLIETDSLPGLAWAEVKSHDPSPEQSPGVLEAAYE